jgi:hypothetical protein
LISLAKNYTFKRECTEKFAYDTRLAQEAITTYLARNRVTWSQNLRTVAARTQDGSRRPNHRESAEAEDNISAMSAQHDDSSVNELLPLEPAMPKENGCLLQ